MQKINHNKRIKKRVLLSLIVAIAVIIALFVIVAISFKKDAVLQTEYAYNNLGEHVPGNSDSLEYEDTLNSNTSEMIYVQHDDNGKDIYLLTSQENVTTVYQIINVNLTASKLWTESGLYVDDPESKCCATAPADYINVTEGEEYFVRLFGLHDDFKGENGEVLSQIAPILFKDDSDNVVGSALGGTYTDGETGVELIIPAGATRMYITYTNFHDLSIQKKLAVNKEQFDQIKSRQDMFLSSLKGNYEEFKNDPVVYNEFDKAYITFVYKGENDDIDKFADLFISKNVPLCFSTYSENLLNIASNGTETKLDVALRIQRSGGEILSHNYYQVATAEKLNNSEFMYEYFAAARQKLKNMGLDVKGILFTSGNDQIMGSPDSAKWVYSTYDYSDLYGEPYDGLDGLSSVYNRWGGTGLNDFNNDTKEIKTYIDKLIQNREWAVLNLQGLSDVSIETVSAVLDYINSKGTDTIEVVTYKKMYDRFAEKESVINNTVKTYYVSADGTGWDGTDIEDPISLDVLNTKKIKTGDTVLFKCGDTFIGSVAPQIRYTNDEKITISSYGEGARPTISAYKYVNKNWEKYSDNIYRIDIMDESNYSGYNYPDHYAFNIGFIEDDNGNKYYHKKNSLDKLTEEFDFYSDGEQYIYFRSTRDPYELLGGLKLAVNNKLFILASNMDISNLRFACTGGHALQIGGSPARNVRISNCVIEDIGGSYLDAEYEERYGNGIEFHSSDAENIEITDNIIRDVYDVAFTIQGDAGSGKDVLVHDNVFVNNAQDSEIWEGSEASGVNNYQFNNNISINQGRGWGYDARLDQDAAAHILFYEYLPKTGDIEFHHNSIYNPRRVYAIKPSMEDFFTNGFIKADYNTYYMAEDSRIFNYIFPSWENEDFIDWAHKDDNSSFISLSEINQNLVNTASTSDDINIIRKAFENVLKE